VRPRSAHRSSTHRPHFAWASIAGVIFITGSLSGPFFCIIGHPQCQFSQQHDATNTGFAERPSQPSAHAHPVMRQPDSVFCRDIVTVEVSLTGFPFCM
jgi:hypothetical protein